MSRVRELRKDPRAGWAINQFSSTSHATFFCVSLVVSIR